MGRADLDFSFLQYSWGWMRYSQIFQQEVNSDHMIFAKFVYFLYEVYFCNIFCSQMALVLLHA